MGPFEDDDSGRSGIYQQNETGKGHHEDDEFPHLSLLVGNQQPGLGDDSILPDGGNSRR